MADGSGFAVWEDRESGGSAALYMACDFVNSHLVINYCKNLIGADVTNIIYGRLFTDDGHANGGDRDLMTG